MNVLSSPVATVVVLLVFAFALFSLSTVVTAIGNPPVSREDPAQPTCPSDFTDGIATATGSATNQYVQDATSFALIDCDPKYLQAKEIQNDEYADNDAICVQVPGCKLTATVNPESHGCQVKPSDCTENYVNGQIVSYTCTAFGKYDIDNYKCAIPPKPPVVK